MGSFLIGGGKYKIGGLVLGSAGVNTGTQELRQTYTGSGILKCITGERAWAIEIDGVRYPTATTEFFNTPANKVIPLDVRFESEIKLYQTTGSSVDQILGLVQYDDGSWGHEMSISGLTQYEWFSYTGKGRLKFIPGGYFALKIDGVYQMGTSATIMRTPYNSNGLYVNAEFEESVELWCNATATANPIYIEAFE